jgi:hypothetical protein
MLTIWRRQAASLTFVQILRLDRLRACRLRATVL